MKASEAKAIADEYQSTNDITKILYEIKSLAERGIYKTELPLNKVTDGQIKSLRNLGYSVMDNSQKLFIKW